MCPLSELSSPPKPAIVALPESSVHSTSQQYQKDDHDENGSKKTVDGELYVKVSMVRTPSRNGGKSTLYSIAMLKRGKVVPKRKPRSKQK